MDKIENISENNFILHNNEHIYKIQYKSIKRQELFYWMAVASENILCEVMKRINPAPYKKTMGPDNARLHALLVAADTVRSALERTGRKNSERDLEHLEESHRLNVDLSCKPKQRRSPKREKLALHEGVIRQLLEKGYSLRQIAAYLHREARIKVTHTYLRQCCLDMGIGVFCRKADAAEGDDACAG